MSGIDSRGLWETSYIGRLVLLLFAAWDDSYTGRLLVGLGRFSALLFTGSLLGHLLFSDWPDATVVTESGIGRALAWLARRTVALGRKLQPVAAGLWNTSVLTGLVRWAGRAFQPVVSTSFIAQSYGGYAADVELMPAENRRTGTSPLLYLLGTVVGLLSLLQQPAVTATGLTKLLSPTMLIIVGIWGIAVLWVGRKIIVGDFEWRASSAGWPLAFFLVVAAGSTIQSVSRKDSLMNLVIWVTAVLLFWMIVNLVRNSRDAAALLGPILAASVLMTAWAVYQQIKPPVIEEHWSDVTEFANLVRSFAGFGNPNYLGEYLMLFLPLALALWIQTPKRRAALTLLLGSMGLGLLLTSSRGAWVGALGALVLFVFMRNRRWSLLLVVAGLAGAVVAPASIIKRLILGITFQDSSAAFRLNVWTGVFDMLKKFWLTGVGLGAVAFEKVYSDFMLGGAHVVHAHNIFLQMFSEMGILGLIAVLWTLLAVIRLPFVAGLNAKGSFITAAVPAALVGILFQGMAEHIWYNPKLLFAFWAVAGLGVGLALGEREGTKA
ncbi:MAG TPA: O-antigen ligase family protein [Symbiobacteriaceae bacterium]|jgi:putative inorganic carbon (HCO3(-)) transporter